LVLNNLVQMYALLCDQGRTEELAELFTPDAEWDGSELGYGTAARADAIARHVTAHFDESDPMMHMTGPVLLAAASETEVHGVAWSLATKWVDGEPRALIHFMYEDEFRSLDEAWRFHRRVLRRRAGPSS
jgi:hypothetical protein